MIVRYFCFFDAAQRYRKFHFSTTSENTNTLNNLKQTVSSSNPAYTFNPLNKLIEVYEENKNLYEWLLEAEKEKIAYLEKLLKGN